MHVGAAGNARFAVGTSDAACRSQDPVLMQTVFSTALDAECNVSPFRVGKVAYDALLWALCVSSTPFKQTSRDERTGRGRADYIERRSVGVVRTGLKVFCAGGWLQERTGLCCCCGMHPIRLLSLRPDQQDFVRFRLPM